MTVTIYHNPNCATSRNVLALIRNSGEEPQVIEYLKAPPSREKLVDLLRRMDIPVRDVLRRKGTPYELGLDDPKWDDDQLIDLMLRHPILINRPIVVTPLGVRLCRPSETVLNILPAAQGGAFHKENGEPVIDDQGKAAMPRQERRFVLAYRLAGTYAVACNCPPLCPCPVDQPIVTEDGSAEESSSSTSARAKPTASTCRGRAWRSTTCLRATRAPATGRSASSWTSPCPTNRSTLSRG